MKSFILATILFALFQSSSGCSKAVIPVKIDPLVLPQNIGPIVVLVDHLPGKERFVEDRAEQVSIGLRYFSTKTSWGYVDGEPIDQVKSAAAVVYLGLNGIDPLTPDAFARLRGARRLVVSRYHLTALRDAGIAFQNTNGGQDLAAPPDTKTRYKGQVFPSSVPDLLSFEVRGKAEVISDYSVVLPDGSKIPYIIQDGNALFVNGEIAFYSSDVGRRGAMLAVCDALTRFFGAHPLAPRPLAMLRLEDVSALTPAKRLDNIVRYLAAAHVPYGIGLIPDLQVKGQAFVSLRDNDGLRKILDWAEGHGATTILHGLHHCCSSDGAEGYEFWDIDHNAPVPYDSAPWMRSKIAEGLADETALGLHPQIWETPHYSASPIDYGVVSEFFGASWELRRPIGWLPWVLRRDPYGRMLLPEDLGYVSLDGTKTVADQIARAREILVCQSCVAAGFLHPSTVSIEDVRNYVDGLRELGYEFVDPVQALHQYGATPIETRLASTSR
jgi:hypothetical protein